MTKLPLLIGAALLATAGAVGAQSGGTAYPTSPSPSSIGDPMSTPSNSSAASGSPSTGSSATAAFSKLDKDQDGMISKKEAGKDKRLTTGWTKADTNKDGKLDAGEFAQFEMSSTGSTSSSMTTTPSP